MAQAIDIVLAARKEFGFPVAMTSKTNMMERIKAGARLFTGGVTPSLRRGSGPLGGRGESVLLLQAFGSLPPVPPDTGGSSP